MSKRHRVLHGIEFMTPTGKLKRLEPGTISDEIPAKSVRWLRDQGHIEEVEDDRSEARDRTAEVKALGGPPEDKMERLVLDKSELIEPATAEPEGE